MAILEIHDKRTDPTKLLSAYLDFDLRDLLAILSPRSQESEWVVCPVQFFKSKEDVFEATGEGGEELEILAEAKSRVNGDNLAAIAAKTRQVIWGQFIAYLGKKGEPWLMLSAIDSTFWEIITEDALVLEKIKRSFKDVRPSSKRYD
jgi:hypothetical protein